MKLDDLPEVTKGIDAKAQRHRYYVGHKPVHINSCGIEVFKGSEEGRFLTENQAREYVDLKRQNDVMRKALENLSEWVIARNALKECGE